MKNTKICSKCNISKELDNFGISKQSKDGLNSICKECRNIDAKEYRNNNKLKIKQKRNKLHAKTTTKTKLRKILPFVFNAIQSTTFQTMY